MIKEKTRAPVPGDLFSAIRPVTTGSAIPGNRLERI
jgi:hypothetical protein